MLHIKVGDRVAFKQWEDFKAEYPRAPYGEEAYKVSRYTSFTIHMKYLCGEEFTVASIDGDSEEAEVRLSPDLGGWFIVPGMLISLEDDGCDVDPSGLDLLL